MNSPLIIYVMGVSGSGKSTIGKLLADALEYPFFDGDDFHPQANINKMAEGHPLNDSDRKGWLESLNTLANTHKNKGAVIVCSALKESYRDLLTKSLFNLYRFVYLKGSMEEISNRLAKREGHFMPKELLQSQFDTLEPPQNSIDVPIQLSPKEIIAVVLKSLKN